MEIDDGNEWKEEENFKTPKKKSSKKKSKEGRLSLDEAVNSDSFKGTNQLFFAHKIKGGRKPVLLLTKQKIPHQTHIIFALMIQAKNKELAPSPLRKRNYF
jgi:hypothetical protein